MNASINHPASAVPPSTDSTAKPTAVRWKIFSIIFILIIINMIDRASLPIAMPTISQEFGLSHTMQGLILSGFFWTYALMQIPGGMYADRFGPRKTVTASTVLWGASQMLLGVCTGGISLLLARLVLGASEAPVFPAGAKLNSNWLHSTERARGATFMDAGGPLGVAVGGVIVSELIAFFDSWRLAFVIAGAATVLLGAVAWHYLRDTPAEHHDVNAAELAFINSDAARDDASSPVGETAMNIPKLSMTGIIFGRAAWAMVFFGLLTWGPSYLAHANNLNIQEIGYATFVIFMAGCLGSLSSGVLADHLVRRGMSRGASLKALLSVSGLCTFAAFLLLPMASNVEVCVALLACASFMLMWGSLYWSLPVLLAPKSRVGVLGGMMNMAGSVGGICIPIIAGKILDATGGAYDPVLYLFAGCAVVFVIMTNLISVNNV